MLSILILLLLEHVLPLNILQASGSAAVVNGLRPCKAGAVLTRCRADTRSAAVRVSMVLSWTGLRCCRARVVDLPRGSKAQAP
ncbi:hypothetical protein BDQ17DRAFT_1355446 [Cyathus striatus]|nr:hypothetical protein BDQ17DRAFT_1355446 [Cyathus striatus]